MFKTYTDDELATSLVSLKGIGPWSAEMFLLFGMRRFNVFSAGDLGIQRGVSVYLRMRPDLAAEMKQDFIKAKEKDNDLDVTPPIKATKSASNKSTTSIVVAPSKKSTKSGWTVPSNQEMDWISERFSPYRSLAMMVMWHLSGIDLGAFKTKQEETDNGKEEEVKMSKIFSIERQGKAC